MSKYCCRSCDPVSLIKCFKRANLNEWQACHTILELYDPELGFLTVKSYALPTVIKGFSGFLREKSGLLKLPLHILKAR
jgi:hypothetical protein